LERVDPTGNAGLVVVAVAHWPASFVGSTK
jgi:hypothetical protein